MEDSVPDEGLGTPVHCAPELVVAVMLDREIEKNIETAPIEDSNLTYLPRILHASG